MTLNYILLIHGACFIGGYFALAVANFVLAGLWWLWCVIKSH